MEILESLNKKQKEAVTCDCGPVLVVAGAGTGKTKVLTMRFWFLVEQLKFNQNEILAITFTNKAAKEMKNRLHNLLSNKDFRWVGTFHSICLRILREDIQYINRSQDFSIIDEEDQISILKEGYKIHNLDTKTFPYKNALSHIEKFKRKDFNFEDLRSEKNWKLFSIKTLKDALNNEKIIKYYLNECIKSNLLDFNDLLKKTLDVLKCEIPREKWSNKFKYILVDEFQDTSDIQYELIKILSLNHNYVFAVGDPDQMIYTWRGANEKIINNFSFEYINSNTIILDINYRSSQEILNTSNNLIRNNVLRIKKDLISNKGPGSKTIYFNANSQDDESRWVANKINKLIEEGKKLKEIVILYRANYLSRNIEQELILNSIPYKIFGGFKFYQRKEIKDVLAYARAYFLHDDLSIKRIINLPRRGISQNTIDIINSFANKNNITFYESLFILDEIEISSQSKKSINDFIKFFTSIKITGKISEDFENILEWSRYLEYLKLNEENDRITNIEELKLSIINYENENPSNTFNDYLQEVILYSSMDESDDQDFINLMTIHISKGLEFDNVFIIGLNEEVFPSKRSMESNEGLEEERRIAYVGITRARNELFLSSYLGFNPILKSTNKQSRFIEEIGKINLVTEFDNFRKISDKDLTWYDSKENKKVDIDNIYNKDVTIFKIGDRIIHNIFGNGIIMSVNGATIEVVFKPPFNKKILLSNHKAIKRIIE